MHLEIGGGNLTLPAGAINLDPAHGSGGWQFRAESIVWPAADRWFGSVRASHVMEHIPAGVPRIHVMNEAWRVLADGGLFEVVVPLFVPGMWQSIADPTHVSFWVQESFAYFEGTLAPNADYGLCYWDRVGWDVIDGWEGHWTGTPRR